MGNNNAKKGCVDVYDRKLDEKFTSLSKNSPAIKYPDLKKAWASQLDPHLYNIIEAYLVKESPNGLKKDVFKDLFLQLCKCGNEDKSLKFVKLIGGNDVVTRKELLEFIASVIRSVIIIQQIKSVKSFKSWITRISESNEETIDTYGRYFLSVINGSDKASFNAEDVKNLLVHFDVFLSMVLASLYQTEENEYFAHLLPRWRYEPIDSGKKLEEISVLDPVKVMFINLELPIDMQDEWRLLFSSAVNGESFSRLCGQICNKGPTVVIIKDKDGSIFGGFAPHSWSPGPNFFGDSRSFLFTLHPEMTIYSPTGFNSNFQYLNVGQQTMPNGLGMGGKLEYFGLWLSADYGRGICSESCTTYRKYKMMSKEKEFRLAHLEVWAVGPPPPTPAELGERSVLDGNVEAKAILEMAGKTAYSDGLREDPKEE